MSLPDVYREWLFQGPLMQGIASVVPTASAARPDGLDEIRYELRIRPENQSPLCHADQYFYSADGRLLGMFMGVVTTGSRLRDRLADANRG